MKDDHFLRPSFTAFIFQCLERGNSINIYGPEGIGKTRLLKDIQDAAPENVLAILVPFNKESHDGFCGSLQNEAKIGGKPLKSLNSIINKLRETKKQVFLLIDNFQDVSDNPGLDPAYNQEFINAINSIYNISGVSLAVVTRNPINNSVIFIDKIAKLSTLYFPNFYEISGLQQKDIRKEIDRRFDKKMLKKQERDMMAVHLCDQLKNYRLLEYYTGKIFDSADSDLEFGTRLRRWAILCGHAECDSFAKLLVRLTTFMKKWMLILTPFRSEFMRVKKLFEGPITFIRSFLKDRGKDD